MTQAPVTASGLVRVTVASGSRRVDLVLPGAVPVAELVPELARSVGLLDAGTVYGGYRLVTAEGRELSGDAGLVMQGVEDGGLLTVAAGVDDEPPRVYDDVVEAMTDVVEHDLRPWEPAAGRRTALCAAGLLMLLGAAALLVQRGALLAGVAAVVVASALVVGAIVLSRAQREPEAAVAVAWMGSFYAAVAALVLVDAGSSVGSALAAAGGAAALAGVLCLVGLGEGRPLVLPPVVVGLVFLLAGMLLRSFDLDPATVLTVGLVAVVILGSLAPWLALGATSTSVDQLFEVADITAEPRPVDPGRVASDARLAHEILVAVTATVGLVVVLVAPVAVALGVVGAVLAVTCCLVVMLRTRQYRTGAEVPVGLGAGIVGLLATAAAALWLHPDWRPTVAVLLAGSGALLLAVTLLPATPSVRRGRLGDVAEAVALLVLLPLLLVAVGVFSAIRG